MDYIQHYHNDALEFDYWGKDLITPAEIRRNQFIQHLCPIKKGQKVLDIGSGRGWFSLHCANMEAEVTAIDLSEENLNRIKNIDPRIKTIYGDACSINLPEKSFDLIVALEVLEHLVDPALAIDNWKKMLKTGGIFFVTVPYKEVIRYSLCIHCNRKTPMNAHLHSWDAPKLASMLENNGFYILRATLFAHKLLSALGLDKKLQKVPFKVWNFLDKLCGIGNDKYSYLAVKAIRQNRWCLQPQNPEG